MEKALKLCEYLDETCWRYDKGGTKHYTGHDHYNSPFETDWNCDNCSGAKCNTCKEIVDRASLELSAPCDKMRDALVKCGYTEEEADTITYDDFCTIPIRYPNHWDLFNNYPEKYDKVIKYLGCRDICRILKLINGYVASLEDSMKLNLENICEVKSGVFVVRMTSRRYDVLTYKKDIADTLINKYNNKSYNIIDNDFYIIYNVATAQLSEIGFVTPSEMSRGY